jgi:hypothetical protein
MNIDAKHRMWIKSIENDMFSIVITYCQNVTKESVVVGLANVRNHVEAFKLLYDGCFEVISDVNFT